MSWVSEAADRAAARRSSGEAGDYASLDLRDSFRVMHPDADEVGTFNSFRGISTGPKIDGVVVWEVIEVAGSAIRHDSRDGDYPSDHFPVTAVLRIAGGNGGS